MHPQSFLRSQATLLVLAMIAGVTAWAAPRPSANTPNLNGAYRFERANWIYVHLAGTPHQMGFEHGYLLAPEIEVAMAAVLKDSEEPT